ncbi:hypothetical protein FOA52_000019 [Chlamydomonas sp. UWO 241]|nr:hypothetical protein FOA52_000019 [Chlamydomonas sp. UWO 241]
MRSSASAAAPNGTPGAGAGGSPGRHGQASGVRRGSPAPQGLRSLGLPQQQQQQQRQAGGRPVQPLNTGAARDAAPHAAGGVAGAVRGNGGSGRAADGVERATAGEPNGGGGNSASSGPAGNPFVGLPGVPPMPWSGTACADEDRALLCAEPTLRVCVEFSGFSGQWRGTLLGDALMGMRNERQEFTVCADAPVASLRRALARNFGSYFWPDMILLINSDTGKILSDEGADGAPATLAGLRPDSDIHMMLVMRKPTAGAAVAAAVVAAGAAAAAAAGSSGRGPAGVAHAQAAPQATSGASPGAHRHAKRDAPKAASHAAPEAARGMTAPVKRRANLKEAPMSKLASTLVGACAGTSAGAGTGSAAASARDEGAWHKAQDTVAHGEGAAGPSAPPERVAAGEGAAAARAAAAAAAPGAGVASQRKARVAASKAGAGAGASAAGEGTAGKKPGRLTAAVPTKPAAAAVGGGGGGGGISSAYGVATHAAALEALRLARAATGSGAGSGSDYGSDFDSGDGFGGGGKAGSSGCAAEPQVAPRPHVEACATAEDEGRDRVKDEARDKDGAEPHDEAESGPAPKRLEGAAEARRSGEALDQAEAVPAPKQLKGAAAAQRGGEPHGEAEAGSAPKRLKGAEEARRSGELHNEAEAVPALKQPKGAAAARRGGKPHGEAEAGSAPKRLKGAEEARRSGELHNEAEAVPALKQPKGAAAARRGGKPHGEAEAGSAPKRLKGAAVARRSGELHNEADAGPASKQPKGAAAARRSGEAHDEAEAVPAPKRLKGAEEARRSGEQHNQAETVPAPKRLKGAEQSKGAAAAQRSDGPLTAGARTAAAPARGKNNKTAALARLKEIRKLSGVLVEDLSCGLEHLPIPVINTVNDQRLPDLTYISDMRYAPFVGEIIAPLLREENERFLKYTNGSRCGLAFNRRRVELDASLPEDHPLKCTDELNYDNEGLLMSSSLLGVHECSGDCTDEACKNNMQVSNGISLPLEVFMTEKKGWGVRCADPIKAGKFICAYVGEVITEAMANKRHGADMYIFAMDHFVELYYKQKSEEQATYSAHLVPPEPRRMDELLTQRIEDFEAEMKAKATAVGTTPAPADPAAAVDHAFATAAAAAAAADAAALKEALTRPTPIDRDIPSGRDDVGGDLLSIDAGHVGNAARFINHSCDPNLIVQPVFTRDSRNTLHYYVALFAGKKDIPAYSEVTYDYIALMTHVAGSSCMCGAHNCSARSAPSASQDEGAPTAPMIGAAKPRAKRSIVAYGELTSAQIEFNEALGAFLGGIKARFAADRGQMITIVSAYSPTEAASDEEAGDFYLRVAALADKANDKRDLLIVAGGSQRRAWDSSQLRRPAVRREFNLQLSDRFGLLEAVPPEGADAQAEYDAMAAAIHEVATNHLAPRGSRRRRGWQFTLSQRTLRLMDARQRAHTAWLRSKSAAAKRERNRANRAADAAVQRDRERWIGQQVAEAQDMLRKKNLRQFARACDRLAGRSRSHQIPPAMRDVSGALHSGPDGVLKAMTESFDKLYGGETKLSDETLNQLENDVAAFELTRATEVDEAHGRPPDLAETETCVKLPLLAPCAKPLDLKRLFIEVFSSGGYSAMCATERGWGDVSIEVGQHWSHGGIIQQVYKYYMLPVEMAMSAQRNMRKGRLTEALMTLMQSKAAGRSFSTPSAEGVLSARKTARTELLRFGSGVGSGGGGASAKPGGGALAAGALARAAAPRLAVQLLRAMAVRVSAASRGELQLETGPALAAAAGATVTVTGAAPPLAGGFSASASASGAASPTGLTAALSGWEQTRALEALLLLHRATAAGPTVPRKPQPALEEYQLKQLGFDGLETDDEDASDASDEDEADDDDGDNGDDDTGDESDGNNSDDDEGSDADNDAQRRGAKRRCSDGAAHAERGGFVQPPGALRSTHAMGPTPKCGDCDNCNKLSNKQACVTNRAILDSFWEKLEEGADMGEEPTFEFTTEEARARGMNLRARWRAKHSDGA